MDEHSTSRPKHLFGSRLYPSHSDSHLYIIGSPGDLLEQKKTEFFKRKCCSNESRDLDRHFKEMMKLYYTLGGDPGLKPIFLSSIPKQIANMVDNIFQNRNRRTLEALPGEIQQALFMLPLMNYIYEEKHLRSL